MTTTETELHHPVPRAPGCPLDPPPSFTAARGTDELTRVRLWDGSTPWLVTRYADVRAVLGDRRVSADLTRPGFPTLSPPLPGAPSGAPSFIRTDDPEHQRLRRMLTRDFRVAATEALRPQVQQLVDVLLDRLHTLPQPVDLVRELALPLPSRVICLLLGVPYADHELFERASTALLDTAADPSVRAAASTQLRSYLDGLAERKLAEPGDDVLSRLVTEREATGELTREDVVGTAVLLLVAGHETTANQTALSVLALLGHPAELAALRADPALVPGAVEELLRWLSVVQTFVGRVATEDVEVGATTVRAGEGVLCILSTGNRDPEQFGEPDRLDVRRDARHHVAFGHGVHQCLGQTLARVELQTVLAGVLARLPGLALAADPAELEFRDANVVYGVRSLPVTFDRAPA